MSADASPFATLGLEPGADQKAIDAAYKKLIKRHHPDVEGGDPARASEINRAYFELRNRPAPDWDKASGGGIAEAIYERRAAMRANRRPAAPHRSWWPVLLLAMGAAALFGRTTLADVSARTMDSVTEALRKPDIGRGTGLSVAAASFLEEPLKTASIEAAVGDATRLLATGDKDEVAEHSRRCHLAMRQSPTIAKLDGCAAFEDAVVMIEGRDPWQDGGAFSASQVTARQMTAARLLTDDYLAIEARLDQIRGRVWLLVSPSMQAQPQPQRNEQP
ncbi:MAG: J domain-containing protein [Sphingomicrobium sp.]